MGDWGTDPQLATIEYCVAITGLKQSEIIVGVKPSRMHELIFKSYQQVRFGFGSSAQSVLVGDIKRSISNFDFARAADLFVVLRYLLGEHVSQERSRSVPASDTLVFILHRPTQEVGSEEMARIVVEDHSELIWRGRKIGTLNDGIERANPRGNARADFAVEPSNHTVQAQSNAVRSPRDNIQLRLPFEGTSEDRASPDATLAQASSEQILIRAHCHMILR
jgi:hypothetical protein